MSRVFGGGSRGGARPPLFLDQKEAPRAEKIFYEIGPARYLRVWKTALPPPPPSLSEGLDQLLVLLGKKEKWRLCMNRVKPLFRDGSRGRVQGVRTPPPGMTCGRFLINTVQSLDRHTKSALWFDMYSQQYTLCYFLVRSPLLRIRF